MFSRTKQGKKTKKKTPALSPLRQSTWISKTCFGVEPPRDAKIGCAPLLLAMGLQDCNATRLPFLELVIAPLF